MLIRLLWRYFFGEYVIHVVVHISIKSAVCV